MQSNEALTNNPHRPHHLFQSTLPLLGQFRKPTASQWAQGQEGSKRVLTVPQINQLSDFIMRASSPFISFTYLFECDKTSNILFELESHCHFVLQQQITVSLIPPAINQSIGNT